MKKTTILIFAFFYMSKLLAQTNNIQEIYLLDKNDFNPYVEFVSSDIKDFFNPEKSSKYPSVNLFDGYLKTCWIAGNTRTNKTSSLYMKVPDSIDLDKVILNIFSGYGKSKSLFYANARPKQIKLSLFVGFYPDGSSTEVVSLYLIKKFASDTIELSDTVGVQSFPLKINKNAFLDFRKNAKAECKTFSGKEYERLKACENPKFIQSLIIKIEILGSYSGTKYDDVCISEIFFNDRFVTAYPDKYNQTDKIFTQNDNTLLANYADKKDVVIYKDTSCVFTEVDWIKHANWAILHYVPNSSVGQGSRIEELYSLIDLKNKKIVDKELKKCTGQYPYFIEKNENGDLLLTTFEDKYKIELK